MTTDPREWNHLTIAATIARADIDHTPRTGHEHLAAAISDGSARYVNLRECPHGCISGDGCGECGEVPGYTLISPGGSCPEHVGRADPGCPACNVAGAEDGAELVVTGGAR